ncbi:DoxX family protein [Brevibacillus sp. SYP-B805]|uniref:DoxX family protein n=1 Tax=Brevibacillus sp. SYP-B805 TaxID=1578199 RepID=UPI0013EC226D|nr:DoxX family protein [Brevibacillus sp. SYP-B805]NGQ94945.1 DoxX family protein [Brevibacillus sp. SYP-B805]
MRRMVAVLILRNVLGLIFFAHGAAKWRTGLEQVAEHFQHLGLPGVLAYAVAGVELIGGIAMMVGWGVRYVAAAFAVIMAGAIVKVKFAFGLLGNGETAGYEFDLILLAVSTYLALTEERQNVIPKPVLSKTIKKM